MDICVMSTLCQAWSQSLTSPEETELCGKYMDG